MEIPIYEELVRTLIKARYQSIDGLVVEWEERIASGALKTGKARDRSTIFKWIAKGLPAKADSVFGFAAALDADPIALLDIERVLSEPHFERERQLFLRPDMPRTPLSSICNCSTRH